MRSAKINIWLIMDGKRGHEKQSEYLVQALQNLADIEITKISSTKSTSTAYISLRQKGELKIFSTATFTDFDRAKGLNQNLREEPLFDIYEECVQVPYKEGFNPKLDKNLEKKGDIKSEIKKYIKHHLKDSHSFYLTSFTNNNTGKKTYIEIPMPVILYDNGFKFFISFLGL